MWNPKNTVKSFPCNINLQHVVLISSALSWITEGTPRPDSKTLCACLPHGIHSVNISPMLGPACILYQWRLYLMSPWGHPPPHYQPLTLLQALAEFRFSLATKRIELGNWLSWTRKQIMWFYKVGNRNLKKIHIGTRKLRYNCLVLPLVVTK